MRILFDRLIAPDTTKTRRLSLGSDWISRQHGRGSNWNKIRVGIQYQFVDVGSPPVGTPRLYVGVGSWLKGIGNYNAHFIGLRTVGASWTRTVTSGLVTYGNMTLTAATVVGQTETTSGSGTVAIGANHASRQWVMFVDIDKTNPSAVSIISYNSVNGSSGAFNFSYDMFIDTMEAVLPNNTQHTRATLSSSLTVNEATNGPLDSVNVAWSRTNFPLEIIGVAVGFYDAYS
jgi:hypothetical protein